MLLSRRVRLRPRYPGVVVTAERPRNRSALMVVVENVMSLCGALTTALYCTFWDSKDHFMNTGHGAAPRIRWAWLCMTSH